METIYTEGLETIEASISASEQYDADLRTFRPAKRTVWVPEALRHGDAFSDARAVTAR